jgi:hypothetical protein
MVSEAPGVVAVAVAVFMDNILLKRLNKGYLSTV